MAQVNKCLRSLFVTYNSVLLSLTMMGLFATLTGQGVGPPTWDKFLGAGITIGITSLGIYGVSKLKTWALFVYSALVAFGVFICLICGLVLVKNKSEAVDALRGDPEAVALYNLIIGLVFAQAVIWFLGVLMAVPLLCQMSRQENRNIAV